MISLILLIYLLVSTAIANNVTYCPSGGVCFGVNVPAATASSGSGDIYFQITGPTTMSWIGLGQGSSMTNANIFMVYADSAGTNVTLSPRLGVGHKTPTPDTTAEVTLLSGSGISNNVMTANVRCRINHRAFSILQALTSTRLKLRELDWRLYELYRCKLKLDLGV